jgi:Zn-dependent alcohol dehydrogenase
MAAVAGVGEDGLEDRFLAELVGAGRLAGIDEQDARVQLGGEFRVGEAVGHDDVGRMQRLPAA